jgi:uncharacterized membrane protein YagU involved in acid resistance
MRKLVRGAIAGAIATVPMTLVMIGLFRRLPPEQRYPLPPRLITEDVAERAGAQPVMHDAALTRATLAAHFGYGAATGALFPFVARLRYPLALVGPGYGLAVWAASYLGWIPALRILSPATRQPGERNALMLTAHVVWGAALAGASALLGLAGNAPGKLSRNTERPLPRESRTQPPPMMPARPIFSAGMARLPPPSTPSATLRHSAQPTAVRPKPL